MPESLEPERSEVVFRPYTPDDRAFIERSWADSYFSACRIKDLLSPSDFHAFHRPLRSRFFLRPTATVIIAAGSEAPDVIMGWIAVEVLPNATAVHYLYVKHDYRREYGLARQLLERAVPQGAVLYTHCTPKAAAIMNARPELFRHFRFCPHLT